MFKQASRLFVILDYYVVAWLMLAKTPFTVDYLESRRDHEQSRAMEADVQQQV